MPHKDPQAYKIYHRQYMAKYRKSKENKAYVRKKQKSYKSRNRAFVDRVKRRFGCKHCKLKDPICLDFHHLKDKKISVGEMISGTHGIETIKLEMRKCIILCANCHRIEEYRKRLR